MGAHSHRGERSESSHGVTRQHALHVNPLTDGWIYLVVFCGGFFGTVARFGLSQWLNPYPRVWDIHWGTFAANLTASFLYALLTAILVGVTSARAKELTSRALGMGFCGGLSTMSTLALEIVGSQFGWLYAIISIVSGVVLAAFGSFLGARIVASRVKKIAREVGVVEEDDSALSAPSVSSNPSHRHRNHRH